MAETSRDEARRVVSTLYGGAHPKHRYYVAAKLKTDPLTDELCELAQAAGNLGRVLDAGGGRGQFGMLLLALDAADSLRGFDLDADKVAAARCAAAAWGARTGALVEQQIGDVLTALYGDADTILLLDVLHYLPRAEQLLVLERAADALTRGGRLVVREATPGSGWGARFAQTFERVARGIGANRGRAMEFVPLEELAQKMRSCGLELESHAPRGPLNNQLLVGLKR